MFGAPKAVHRIVVGALIASTILLRPSASRALDNVTLITDFGYNGRHAHFFEALETEAAAELAQIPGQPLGEIDPARIEATLDVVKGAFKLATPVAAADVYAPGFVTK